VKIKIFKSPIIINIISVLLILSIFFIHSNAARIILGLPFILFLPGYALISALLINKRETDHIEMLALSCGMSIAIVALIGFSLNFTPWGIRLEPILYSVAGFTLIMSTIASIREALLPRPAELTMELNIKFPTLQGSKLSKSFSICLIISILASVGILVYSLEVPNFNGAFTEFYVLGVNGKAQDYPTEFIIENGRVIHIQYTPGSNHIADEWGKVSLGIINQEQQNITYTIKVMINNEPVSFNCEGVTIDQLSSIELKQGEKWEKEIGFIPLQAGDNQKVEFLLFKNDSSPSEKLILWYDVKEIR
jgi:uncharacterized membrane protein